MDFIFININYFFFFLDKYAITLNEVTAPSAETKLLSSPVFTLAVVSPGFTGVLVSTDGLFGFISNPDIAFVRAATIFYKNEIEY